ncbi:MAG: guanosine-3',5'-bis(diphosphate) 3'-pyrophosphohydrolase [Phenylobacterium sp.]|jgi:guanosine-3',5'-bis(diphosphate) 3'-pyrophosphohydrolase
MYLFEALKQQISQYLSAEQTALVQQAYIVARNAHEGQMRSSGEPYITHPVAVASILADINLDHETLMSALLHDVIEDTDNSKEDLAELFGATVADLVEGVSKLEKLRFKDKKELQVENYRKMFMAMTQDIRVILIKLADRTHNMRTLGSLRPDKRRRIARETLDIYAPIANRLGIHDTKNELESLGFAALYPMRARALGTAVKQARGNRKEIINNIRNEIASRIEESGIQGQIIGREKDLYSIYRKMASKVMVFNEVMDIYAFRVIVDSYDTCYRVLGVVHNLFKPIETRFKDYIAIPKSNGYQSLHTSLIGPHGVPIEIQIRTEEMNLMADRGVAAHWSYKQGSKNASTTAQQRAHQWMQSLLELQQSAGSSFEFIENVKTELFPEEIYVFTPDGSIVELPMGATPVDFAYAVHTDVGSSCVGAKVDRKPHPLNVALDTGQTIEVITSPGGSPNANWLNFVVTGKARQGIRNYLKSQQAEEALALGRRLLSSALGETKLEDFAKDTIDQVVVDLKQNSFETLLIEIGQGNLMSFAIARRLIGDGIDTDTNLDTVGKHNVPIVGTEGMLVTYAKCCRPIAGDDIVAYMSQGKGLAIHRSDCRNIKGWQQEPAVYFPVKWDNTGDKLFVCEVRVEIINHQGALAQLTNQIASTGANIQALNTEEKESNLYIINVELLATDRVHLANIMRKIRVMPDIQKIYRRK